MPDNLPIRIKDFSTLKYDFIEFFIPFLVFYFRLLTVSKQENQKKSRTIERDALQIRVIGGKLVYCLRKICVMNVIDYI
jgi:hypothetical protein